MFIQGDKSPSLGAAPKSGWQANVCNATSDYEFGVGATAEAALRDAISKAAQEQDLLG